MIQRLALLGLSLFCFALLIPGCGDSSSPSAAGSGDNAQASKPKLGVTIPAADHGWTAGIGWWARQAMAKHGDVDWVYATANTPTKQTTDIDNMLTQGAQGLVILATESAPLTPAARRAKQRGLDIVNVDRGFLEPVANVFLEGDNKAFGRKSAEFVAEKLDGKGKIVILRGIPCTVDTDRYEAGMAVFKQHPEIEVLGVQPGMWSKDKALTVMENFLTQYKHIDAVWAQDDDMALGVAKAIQEANRTDEMWIFGGAGMKDVVAKVQDGDSMFPATITYPPAMIAAGIHIAAGRAKGMSAEEVLELMPEHLHLTLEQVEAALKKSDEQAHIKLDVYLVTPDNASEYYFKESVY